MAYTDKSVKLNKTYELKSSTMIDFKYDILLKILQNYFSTKQKNDYEKLEDLYYDNKIFNIIKYNNIYLCSSKYYPTMFIIFDELHKTNFILGFCNPSPNDNYRYYSLITIKDNNFKFKIIPEFDYLNLWNFDNRNYIFERLYNNKLCIFVKHRYNFDNNFKITIIDINSDYKSIIKEYICNGFSFIQYKDITISNNSIMIYNTKYIEI